MQNKYKLPDDIKRTAISIVRGQERRKREYHEECDNIINAGGANYVTYTVSKEDEPERARAYLPSAKSGNNISDTERKAFALEKLKEKSTYKTMFIVEEELNNVGSEIPNEQLRKKLSNAVYLNCVSRKYPYERFYLSCISRNSFYKYKCKFLYDVAKKLELF